MKKQKETTITSEKGKQEMFIVREFEALRDLVFKAHIDQNLVTRWMGPNDLEMKIEKYNAVSGGAYRYAMRNVTNEHVSNFNGAFHEVTAPERIIQTFEFEGMPERGHVTLDTTTFEELPSGRTRVTIHSLCRTLADRDGLLGSGMVDGFNQGYERLDDLLEEMKG